METEPEARFVIPGVSEEEYYAQDEDSPWEYLGGDLVREPASFRHEDLCFFLHALLRSYLDERGGGVVSGSRFPMRLDEKWSPEPDVLVVREERRHLIAPQRLEGPADLVIEIISPAHPEIALKRKLPRYREARVPEIWTINPYSKSIRVDILASDGYHTQILGAGRLATAVIPGFWIDVSWLWQEPLPALLSCLRQILA